MNKEKSKLSLAGRFAKWSLSGGTSHENSILFGVAFLLVAFAFLGLAIKTGENGHVVFSVCFGFLSLLGFQRAGFHELLKKEYEKKQLEQSPGTYSSKAANGPTGNAQE